MECLGKIFMRKGAETQVSWNASPVKSEGRAFQAEETANTNALKWNQRAQYENIKKGSKLECSKHEEE